MNIKKENKIRQSATVIVPQILRLIPNLKSVVDFGCEPSIWLREFQFAGLRTQGCYNIKDFSSSITFNQKFDLAISLEAAEHIPPECSDIFIASLTNASDIILFSAAVPGQDETNHQNEQWPSYWIDKFSRRSFFCMDILRPMLWNDNRIAGCYRQNIMFFIEKGQEQPESVRSLESFYGQALVHPYFFFQKQNQLFTLRNDFETLKNSQAYISNNDSKQNIKKLKWFLRKTYGFFRCIKYHGILYTMKLFAKKVFRALT
jgi:hypothetical protein